MPAALVSKCAGVSPGNRRTWVRRDPQLVRGGPRFTAHDAIETAIVGALADTTQKLGPAAWLAVRQDVRKLVLAGVEDLWILVSATGLSHSVATGPEEAARRAAGAGEAYYVVSVRDRILDARARFEAEVAKLQQEQRAPRVARAETTP